VAGRRGRPPAGPERRNQILAAALECFVTRGFHGTAVPQVAKAAGIASGTIYHYFPSKEALVNALFRHWKNEIAKYVFMGFPGTAPPREQFRAMFQEMVAFALANPKAFAFLELHNHRSYLDEESLAIESRLKDFGAMMVQRAQNEGLIKDGPPALLMELVFGAFNGMLQAHWEGRIELDEPAQVLAERACWEMVARQA